MNKCNECLNWQKVSGTKKQNNDQGLCDFMMHRIDDVNKRRKENRDFMVRGKGNKSLVINVDSNFEMNINGLRIETDDPNLLRNSCWIWTEGHFGCVQFLTK
jgi:hypothetical protein